MVQGVEPSQLGRDLRVAASVSADRPWRARIPAGAWPDPDSLLNACAPAGEDDQGVAALHFAATVLAAIRKKKSEEQRPLKTPVARAVIQAPAQQLELLALVEKDLRASGLIRELETSVGDTFEVTVALAPPEAGLEKVP